MTIVAFVSTLLDKTLEVKIDNQTQLKHALNMKYSNWFEKSVKTSLEHSQKNIHMIIGLEIDITIEGFFESIYTLAMNTQPILSIENGNENPDTVSIPSFDKERFYDYKKLIITYIISGNKQSAISIFDKIVQEIKPLNLLWIQNFMVDFFAEIVSKIKESDPKTKYTFVYSDIFSFKNIDELSDWGTNRLDELITNEDKETISYVNRAVYNIKKYISKNFMKDITLEDISDQVFLSPVYISRLFKEQTGVNFSDYLITIRMEKAKYHLNDLHYKVYEVAQMVGYRSTKHFYRLFKRYQGCTPTEYRNCLDENEKEF